MSDHYRPMPPSHASLFFGQIVKLKSRAFGFLEKLAIRATQTDENEWREFKSGGFTQQPARPQLDPKEKIKTIWSESLGAFSNSGGGVLIWGIRAPNRIVDGTDLVPAAEEFAARLRELTSDAVDPPIVGVEIVPVLKRASTAGFVVCYVPASDFAPHRSLWAKREYYMRVQDGNRPIPTAVLRRMFYPQSTPYLVPILAATIDYGADGFWHLRSTLDLVNEGTASAESILIYFLPVDQGCKTYATPQWSSEIVSGGFNFTSPTPLHPGQSVRILNNCTNNLRDWTTERVLTFQFQIFAKNSSAIRSEVSFTTAELLSAGPNHRLITRKAIPM